MPRVTRADMTYLGYHLVFNLPVFLLLWWLTRRRLRAAHWKWIGVVAFIAFVFTTPWDNWAVAQGMWDFDWERVIAVEISAFGSLWRLPLEEYAFFVIMTVNVCLLAVLMLPAPPAGAEDGRNPTSSES